MKTNLVTFAIIVAALLYVMWFLFHKVNNFEQEIEELSIRVDSLSNKMDSLYRIDSLYWEHLSKCAFISQDIIEYDKHGWPKIVDYPFIARNPKSYKKKQSY